jgi:hypothetical protein
MLKANREGARQLREVLKTHLGESLADTIQSETGLMAQPVNEWRMKYDPSGKEITLKIVFTEGDFPFGREGHTYEVFAAGAGLDPAWLGKSVKNEATNGKTVTITGWRSRARKQPVAASINGKPFVVTVESIKRLFEAEYGAYKREA